MADHLLFNFFEILSLQTLAATELALLLWRDKICNEAENPEEFRCQEMIYVPTHIADVIDERISLVGNELRSWIETLTILCTEHSAQEISTANVFQIYSLFFDDIVFKQDCTICLKSTVTSILTSTKAAFEPTAKYRMACEFCLENCVRQFWPSVKNNVDLLGQSPLVLYWNSVMMEKKRKAISIDNGLITSVTNKNWTAVEYFWNKSPRTKQTLRAIDILQDADFHVMKFLLPKLNDNQAKKVCAKVGDYIFGKMMENDEYFKYAMKYWFYLKDFISGNTFTNLIRQMWLTIFNPSELNLGTNYQNGAVIHEIFVTAPDRLKAFVLERDIIDGLFVSLDDQVRGVENYDVKFVLELLANASYEQRRAVWLENWRKLIIRAEPSKLEELMGLCLANEEIEEFKENRMANFDELESYFSSCIEKNFISELCRYVNFCVKNSLRLENLSKKILLSNLSTILSWNDEIELAKFHSLIHGTFRNSQSASKVLEELILAPEFVWVIHCKLDEGRFDEVVTIASRFTNYETHLNEMKRQFLCYSRSNLTRGRITGFVRQKFECFLRWCCLSETSIFEFKKSLIIDDIFRMNVIKLIEERSISYNSKTVSNLDSFLEWYFGGSENAKVYKSTRVIHHEEFKGLKMAFREASSAFIDQFLEWAFGDDTDRIEYMKFALRK